jgi:hypothetical protein
MLDRLRTKFWHARDGLRDRLQPGHRAAVFTRIYEENLWDCDESRSGVGSSAAATVAIMAALPKLWQEYAITTLVDAPCGDCNWMSRIAGGLDSYVGVDIVPALIEANRSNYPELAFECGDLTSRVLPKAHAILCRDCFQHLPTRMIVAAMDNFRLSGARWVFLTSSRNTDPYRDVVIGGARSVNLQLPPFNFSPPSAAIVEDRTGRYLGLWPLG